MTQRSSDACSTQLTPCRKTEAALDLERKFPTIEKFFGAYSTSMQERCAQNPERCFFGKAPALSLMAAVYGKKNTRKFILAQMANLARYCGGNASAANVEQVQELSSVILTEYYWLNAAELLLFVHRFKCGNYGKFYKSFEPLTIMQGLKQFVLERGNAFAEKEKQDRLAEIESAQDGISYSEYLQLKKAAQRGDELALERLQKPNK